MADPRWRTLSRTWRRTRLCPPGPWGPPLSQPPSLPPAAASCLRTSTTRLWVPCRRRGKNRHEARACRSSSHPPTCQSPWRRRRRTATITWPTFLMAETAAVTGRSLFHRRRPPSFWTRRFRRRTGACTGAAWPASTPAWTASPQTSLLAPQVKKIYSSVQILLPLWLPLVTVIVLKGHRWASPLIGCCASAPRLSSDRNWLVN